MNDKSLREILHRVPVPPPDDAARENALARAEIAYANRLDQTFGQPTDAAYGGDLRMLLGAKRIGFACAMLFLVWFALTVVMDHGLRRRAFSGRSEMPGGKENRADVQLLVEMETLFHGQLQAVISRRNEVSLDLSAAPSTNAEPSSQPLAVVLRRGRQMIRVLGFSGREVCVLIDGRKECFEPLVNGNGKVFLVGHDFIWNGDHPTPVAGYKVEAHPLFL